MTANCVPEGTEPGVQATLSLLIFRAQPEHAVRESCPAGAAKDYQSSRDAKCPPNVRMTTDEDSRDSNADAQRHAQGTIHSPQIQNHRRIGCESRYALS